ERALSSDQPLAIPFQAPFNSYSFFFVLAAGILFGVGLFPCLGFFNKHKYLSCILYFSCRLVPPPSSPFFHALHPPSFYFFSSSLPLSRWVPYPPFIVCRLYFPSPRSCSSLICCVNSLG